MRDDASNLEDLAPVRYGQAGQGKIDILFASAGEGEAAKLGEITEKHLGAGFALIVRGTLLFSKWTPAISVG